MTLIAAFVQHVQKERKMGALYSVAFIHGKVIKKNYPKMESLVHL